MKLLNKLRANRGLEQKEVLTQVYKRETLEANDEHETMFEHKQYSQELMCPLEPHRTVW
jgi:hypothetical protein